ncbi:tRNA 2-thiouridine synthesizing protein A [Natronocella acetinitrilica]|uniref:tRNA 2-thiouridine synthesizing protein A n=1 Tax=Natronocella acetinitrilica TaxID=414046 RepID=A0AAE3G3J6_9GAMM|nr:sulfurtransferase TusA family protein [Natronocella acetinitrilica]MCP1675165.1 tRNA 2-thiouridine synthesizing protein A [Natronocella acetinitrilica]
MTNQHQHQLDARGLNCPLPILQTKRALLRLAVGEVLRVEATDPHAVIDFLAFTEKTNHRMLSHREQDGVYIFLVEKGED